MTIVEVAAVAVPALGDGDRCGVVVGPTAEAARVQEIGCPAVHAAPVLRGTCSESKTIRACFTNPRPKMSKQERGT